MLFAVFSQQWTVFVVSQVLPFSFTISTHVVVLRGYLIYAFCYKFAALRSHTLSSLAVNLLARPTFY